MTKFDELFIFMYSVLGGLYKRKTATGAAFVFLSCVVPTRIESRYKNHSFRKLLGRKG